MIQRLLKKLIKKSNLEERLKAKDLSNIERYNNIMKFANEILEEECNKSYEHPIFDFIRILGRGIQSDYMKYVIYYNCNGKEHNVPNLEWQNIGFDMNTKIITENSEIIRLSSLYKEIECNRKLNLTKDLVLPWPWNRQRLYKALINIGEGRPDGKWKQDYNNHYVDVWLPLGIAWVGGGNHSITMGIIQGGELEAEYFYDISDVYKHVKCDGENYIRVETNAIFKDKIIAPVTSVEFAAIFEIGRLLVEKGISFVDGYYEVNKQ